MAAAKRERPERDPAPLHHMLDLARAAVSYTTGRSLDEVSSNWIHWQGLSHSLTLIGRNAGRVSSQGRAALPEVDWTGLIETGELLITEYNEPHEQLVWRTINEDLPPLIVALERILAEPPPDSEMTHP